MGLRLKEKKYGSCVEFAPMPDTIKFLFAEKAGDIFWQAEQFHCRK